MIAGEINHYKGEYMKTIRTANGSIMRVKDAEAERMVNGEGPYKRGDYYYCSKKEWKKEIRDKK